MKTVKGLHEKMGTFENANTSFHQAARCKRYTNEVLAFSMVKEEELLRATEEIQNLTYRQTQNAYMMQLYIETRCFCDFINGKYTHF